MGFNILWLLILGVTLARAAPASNEDSSASESQSAITQVMQKPLFCLNFLIFTY